MPRKARQHSSGFFTSFFSDQFLFGDEEGYQRFLGTLQRCVKEDPCVLLDGKPIHLLLHTESELDCIMKQSPEVMRTILMSLMRSIVATDNCFRIASKVRESRTKDICWPQYDKLFSTFGVGFGTGACFGILKAGRNVVRFPHPPGSSIAFQRD